MTTFRYDAAILERFPAVTGGVILATGLRNGPTPEPLRAAYLEEQRATLARIGATPLSQLPSLAAWRSAFRRFGVDPTQCRCAAEALLRRLTKKGDIPSINTLVDLGNLVSIRYALPVAVFDRHALTGPLTVRFATGHERYMPLGQPDVTEHPTVGRGGLCRRRGAGLRRALVLATERPERRPRGYDRRGDYRRGAARACAARYRSSSIRSARFARALWGWPCHLSHSRRGAANDFR